MTWISVKDQQPPRPSKRMQLYFVIVQRDGKKYPRIGKWEIIPNKQDASIMPLSKAIFISDTCAWRVGNFKEEVVTHWMDIPKLKKSEMNATAIEKEMQDEK